MARVGKSCVRLQQKGLTRTTSSRQRRNSVVPALDKKAILRRSPRLLARAAATRTSNALEQRLCDSDSAAPLVPHIKKSSGYFSYLRTFQSPLQSVYNQSIRVVKAMEIADVMDITMFVLRLDGSRGWVVAAAFVKGVVAAAFVKGVAALYSGNGRVCWKEAMKLIKAWKGESMMGM